MVTEFNRHHQQEGGSPNGGSGSKRSHTINSLINPLHLEPEGSYLLYNNLLKFVKIKKIFQNPNQLQ
jgi:hypothetical protein